MTPNRNKQAGYKGAIFNPLLCPTLSCTYKVSAQHKIHVSFFYVPYV